MVKKREPSDSSSIQSVDRALTILFLLADAQTPLTVGEIAGTLGVHNSTASRLLSTLAQQNVVVASRNGYRLGLGLLRLTHVVINELQVRTVAHPHLQRLCQSAGGTTYLATLLDGDELYLDQVEADGQVWNANWIGRTIPPHSASSGKVLLAHLPEDEMAAYLGRELVASTRFTVTDPQELKEQLALIRERGYAVAVNEHLMGFGSVSAPIFDRSGHNVAVIVLGGPTAQFSIERFHALAPMVMASASAIGIELGYKPERG